MIFPVAIICGLYFAAATIDRACAGEPFAGLRFVLAVTAFIAGAVGVALGI